jgi:hypothetical protein
MNELGCDNGQKGEWLKAALLFPGAFQFPKSYHFAESK